MHHSLAPGPLYLRPTRSLVSYIPVLYLLCSHHEYTCRWEALHDPERRGGYGYRTSVQHSGAELEQSHLYNSKIKIIIVDAQWPHDSYRLITESSAEANMAD